MTRVADPQVERTTCQHDPAGRITTLLHDYATPLSKASATQRSAVF